MDRCKINAWDFSVGGGLYKNLRSMDKRICICSIQLALLCQDTLGFNTSVLERPSLSFIYEVNPLDMYNPIKIASFDMFGAHVTIMLARLLRSCSNGQVSYFKFSLLSELQSRFLYALTWKLKTQL